MLHELAGPSASSESAVTAPPRSRMAKVGYLTLIHLEIGSGTKQARNTSHLGVLSWILSIAETRPERHTTKGVPVSRHEGICGAGVLGGEENVG